MPSSPRKHSLAVAATFACLLATGQAQAVSPRFTGDHDFGNVPIGQTRTITHIFLDQPSGSDRLRTLYLDHGGMTSGDFTLGAGDCVPSAIAPSGTVLRPGVGCTLSITYAPTTAGPAETQLTSSNYMEGHWGILTIRGSGVPAPAPAARPVPATGPWALALLSLALPWLAGLRRRRQRAGT